MSTSSERVVESLLALASERFGRERTALSPNDDLFEALEIDSMQALSLLYLINTRHDLGIPVTMNSDPKVLSPFVSRDSAFNHIVGLLNLAQTELQAAGTTAFPFTFHSGYTGFNTPATYLTFNRASAARVNAYRASLGVAGCGAARSAACYNTVLTNLTASFLNAAGSLNA